jgi:preprotein translocase subunit SecD
VQLNFRPVVMPPVSAAATTTSLPPTASTPPTVSTPPSAAPAPVAKTSDPFKGITFAVPLDDTAYNKLKPAQQQELQARLATYDCRTDQPDGIPERNKYMLACDKKAADASAVYLLGKVIVPGTEISSASAVPPNVGGTGGGTAEWTVSLNLKSTGQGQWAKYTGAHNTGGQDTTTPITSCGSSGTPCADYVAFTLDGAVISAPYNRDAINGQATQISGSFTQQSATQLAAELNH